MNREDILRIMKSCEVVRLGMVDEEGGCYIVHVNFGLDEQEGWCSLYFHSALEGKKISILHRNPMVSFEMDTAHALETGEKCSDPLTFYVQNSLYPKIYSEWTHMARAIF